MSTVHVQTPYLAKELKFHVENKPYSPEQGPPLIHVATSYIHTADILHLTGALTRENTVCKAFGNKIFVYPNVRDEQIQFHVEHKTHCWEFVETLVICFCTAISRATAPVKASISRA